MRVILPLIMKKYRKFIKMMNKLKRSTTHMSIENTKNKLGDVNENSDSNVSDDDWDRKSMWKDAIDIRRMGIYDNIVENFEDEESEEADIEEAEEHQHYGKRSREDDELPDLKRHKINHLKHLNYHNPLMNKEQLQQAQE